MDEAGLWNLFFATGLPEAYLALRGQQMEERCRLNPPAIPAFRPLERELTQI